MKTLHSVIAIGLVGCLLALPLAEARALQEARPPVEPGISDWDNLQRLLVGDKVEVVSQNLSKHKGKVLTWTEESISLRLKNQDITLSREEVFRVTLLSENRRGRNALIGLVVGAGVGAAVSQGGEGPQSSVWMLIIPFFGGIGAGVGAAFPSHPTVYRALRRKSEDGK